MMQDHRIKELLQFNPDDYDLYYVDYIGDVVNGYEICIN